MKRCQARYYPTVNKVKIDANSTEFYPQYLKYLFEYLKIPQNATIVFKDITVIGGVTKWLENKKEKKYGNNQN